MPNRGQTQDPQRGRRNPTQTSPDDDEAQLADQTRLEDEDTEGQQPTETKRRGLQTSQEREGERLAQAGNEEFAEDEAGDEADDDEDMDDTIGPTS